MACHVINIPGYYLKLNNISDEVKLLFFNMAAALAMQNDCTLLVQSFVFY